MRGRNLLRRELNGMRGAPMARLGGCEMRGSEG